MSLNVNSNYARSIAIEFPTMRDITIVNVYA